MRFFILIFFLLSLYEIKAQRDFFPDMGDSLVRKCPSQNSDKKGWTSFSVYLAKDSTIINNKKYYAFSIGHTWKEGDNVTLGYLRYEDDKMYFLNVDYNNELFCNERQDEFGVYGNICKEEIMLSFTNINTYYYIHNIGIMESYFIVLREVQPQENDTLYHYELKPSNIRNEPSHQIEMDISNMVISKKRGFL